jgi:DNA-binding HxlR family transcriptional regulator
LNEETNDINKTLFEHPREIAELLRSASNPARVRVIASLLQGENRFSSLMRTTGLSKTALANHLYQLAEKRIIERVSRGEYRLTTSGTEFVRAVARIYAGSALSREDAERELLRSYTKSFTVGRRIITKKVEEAAAWLSYTSAMAASLRALGIIVDKIDVAGRSGYAFLVNVSKGIISPAGPTTLSIQTWSEIMKGTESLGWTLERYTYPYSYPMKEGSSTAEEIAIARRLFVKIKKEIDEKDRPVVLWGVFAPVYGVVIGYDGESYVTPKTNEGVTIEKHLTFFDLKAPGQLDAFFFRDRIRVDSKHAVFEALKRAVEFAGARTPVIEKFIAGPRAFDEWAETLMNLRQGDQDYMGNSYLGACYAEGHNMASKFLNRVATKLHGEASAKVQEAALFYGRNAKLLGEFSKLFPFKYQGRVSLSERKEGVALLRKASILEEESLNKLREAVRSIRSSDWNSTEGGFVQ